MGAASARGARDGTERVHQRKRRYLVRRTHPVKRGETILSRRVDQWDQWIASGHAGLAIRDVDALPASFDDQKPFLRVQLMHKAGLLKTKAEPNGDGGCPTVARP